MFHLKRISILVFFLLVLGVFSGQTMADVINCCAKKNNGQLRIVNDLDECLHSELPYILNGTATQPCANAPDLIGAWRTNNGSMVYYDDYTDNNQEPEYLDVNLGIEITHQKGNLFAGYSLDERGNKIYLTGVIECNQVTMQQRHNSTWHLMEGRLIYEGSEIMIIGNFYGNEDRGTPPSATASGTFEIIKDE